MNSESLPCLLHYGILSRYIAVAQALVMRARGILKQNRKDIWVLEGTGDYGSHDDITCTVIPLLNWESSSHGSNSKPADCKRSQEGLQDVAEDDAQDSKKLTTTDESNVLDSLQQTKQTDECESEPLELYNDNTDTDSRADTAAPRPGEHKDTDVEEVTEHTDH